MYKRPAIKSTKVHVPLAAPVSPWVAKINDLIACGKLVHVDTDEKGRKVYRLNNLLA